MTNEDRDTLHRQRSAARLYALQALFQMESSGQGLNTVKQEFLEHRFGADYDDGQLEDGDIDLFVTLLEGAVNWQAKIDQMTDRALVEKWPIKRIDPTLRALFRAAGAELLQDNARPRLIIKEFVDIAGAFFPGGKETGFVNAVLDHIAREARPQDF